MKVNVFDSREEMGKAAGKAVEKKILDILVEKENVRIIFAAAPSQDEFLAYLNDSKIIPWDRVVAFHMDEYVDLSEDSPALFSNFLRRKLFNKLPFKKVHLIEGQQLPEDECKRYSDLLQEAPIDIVCMGIGENGHIAFNDPSVADFDDPEIIKKVELEPSCRVQQVNDGCFLTMDEVPTHALTLTIPTLLQTEYICCVVPGENKRVAVHRALNGTIHTECPASILRLHPNCDLYTDRDAFSESTEPEDPNQFLAKDCLSEDHYFFQLDDKINKIKIGASYIHNPEIAYFGPGLVDLQVNGVNGIDFNETNISVEDIEKSTRFLLGKGVTTFFPTLITNEKQAIITILKTFLKACEEIPIVGTCIGGIHLEGPFISHLDGARGAHDQKLIQKPSWDLIAEFQEASGGMIKLITLAPEREDSSNLIKKCVENGIKVAIGHSIANKEALIKACESGAGLVTHFGNAIPLMLPRHPNILWDQLAIDSLFVSLIADGFHLDDSVLKVILKVKDEKVILVSDTTKFCGMPPGEYKTHIGDKVILEQNGRLSLKSGNGLLAGASLSLLEDVQHLIQNGLIGFAQAWKMGSVIPAFYMEIPPTQFEDDLVVFHISPTNPEIQVFKVIKTGIPVF